MNKPKNNKKNQKRKGNTSTKTSKDENSLINHDNMFKYLLHHCFEDYIRFTQPEFGEELDFSHKVPLSEHVSTLQAYKGIGNDHTVDLAIETRNKHTDKKLIVHIEAQSYNQKIFPDRMLNYYIRCQDSFRPHNVVSHAVCFNQNQSNISDEVKSNHGTKDGTKLEFKYVKIEVYSYKVADHINSSNLFALACLGLMDGVYNMDEYTLADLKIKAYKNLQALQISDNMQLDVVSTFLETYIQLNENGLNYFNAETKKDKELEEWIMNVVKENSYTRELRNQTAKETKLDVIQRLVENKIQGYKDGELPKPALVYILSDESLAKDFDIDIPTIKSVKNSLEKTSRLYLEIKPILEDK